MEPNRSLGSPIFAGLSSFAHALHALYESHVKNQLLPSDCRFDVLGKVY